MGLIMGSEVLNLQLNISMARFMFSLDTFSVLICDCSESSSLLDEASLGPILPDDCSYPL